MTAEEKIKLIKEMTSIVSGYDIEYLKGSAVMLIDMLATVIDFEANYGIV